MAEAAKTEPVLLTRNYRYRLRPTPVQVEAFERAMKASRRLWNACVTAQKLAMKAVRHGRKERVVSELRQRYLAKRLVGMLSVKVRKVMAEKKVDEAKARELIAADQAAKQAKYRRSLAIQYGSEAGQAHLRHHWPGAHISSTIGWGTVAQYLVSGGRWAKYEFGELRRKRAVDTAPLRWQVQKGNFALDRFITLPTLGQVCEKVECVNHRPLPKQAAVKQLSLTRDSMGHWYLTVALDCPPSSVARAYGPSSGKIAGVNPGIKLRLTVVDGASPAAKPVAQTIDRPNHRMDRQDRKLARRLRKLDRQIRANNPECFDEKGRWKKGARAKVKSKAMDKERKKANKIQLHAAEVRRDHYHKAAVWLLRQYETVRVGKWRPADTAEAINPNNAPGVAIRRRRTNKKAYRQAISIFINALQDKAKLSVTPRSVESVEEKDSTKSCPVCHLLTGPRDVKVRKWTCVSCGNTFVREHAAAWNLAQISAAGANTVQPVRSKGRAKSGSVTPAKEPNEGVSSP